MSRNCFMSLLRTLYFNDDENPHNHLNKIQPIVTYLNNKMKDIYKPSKHLALDESMVLFRERLVFVNI